MILPNGLMVDGVYDTVYTLVNKGLIDQFIRDTSQSASWDDDIEKILLYAIHDGVKRYNEILTSAVRNYLYLIIYRDPMKCLDIVMRFIKHLNKTHISNTWLLVLWGVYASIMRHIGFAQNYALAVKWIVEFYSTIKDKLDVEFAMYDKTLIFIDIMRVKYYYCETISSTHHYWTYSFTDIEHFLHKNNIPLYTIQRLYCIAHNISVSCIKDVRKLCVNETQKMDYDFHFLKELTNSGQAYNMSTIDNWINFIRCYSKYATYTTQAVMYILTILNKLQLSSKSIEILNILTTINLEAQLVDGIYYARILVLKNAIYAKTFNKYGCAKAMYDQYDHFVKICHTSGISRLPNDDVVNVKMYAPNLSDFTNFEKYLSSEQQATLKKWRASPL